MRYYDELARYQREGFEIIVDKTWEDLSPRDCFDDSVTDIDEICRKIDSYDLDWFMPWSTGTNWVLVTWAGSCTKMLAKCSRTARRKT
jgi:hypothetical protein